MSIFKAYDIRGVYPSEINEVIARRIGIAYANYMKDKDIIIGMDVRNSSPSLKRAVIEGILSAGKNVTDIGIVPTPILYFGVAKEKRKSGLMITASHNPAEYNGIKLEKAGAIGLTGERGIRDIKNMVLTGKGMKEKKNQKAKKKTKVRKKNLENDYIKFVTKKIKLKKKLKIVIDAGNGCCGPISKKLFNKLGCKVIGMNMKQDGDFPVHIADPHQKKTLRALQKKVIEKKAHLGIAYDGDGDRAGFVDDRGRVLTEEQFIIALSRQALSRKRGSIVLDIRASNKIVKDIKYHGGKAVIVRAGHSYIAEKLFRLKGIFGAEGSGHLFFPYDYFYYDDALYASLKMAEIASSVPKFSEYVDALPKIYASPEIRLDYPDNLKFEFIKKVKSYLKKNKYRFLGIDGARIIFEKGWALVRASNTQPQITIKIEGNTKKDLEDSKHRLKRILRDCGFRQKF